MTPDALPLTRGGHLSDLTVDRFLYEPDAPETFRAAVEDHLQDCAQCSEEVDAIRRVDATVQLAPPRPLAPVIDLSARRRRWAVAGASVLALAAAAVLMLRPGPLSGPDLFRAKGPQFAFEVHVDEGSASRQVVSLDVVHPGDRFGFRVQAKTAGYLLVAGVDHKGETYICYPQDGPAPAPLSPSPTPTQLDAAMRFDTVLGEERLIALFCPEPFDAVDALARMRVAIDGVPAAQALPLVGDGCTQREVILEKTGGDQGIEDPY